MRVTLLGPRMVAPLNEKRNPPHLIETQFSASLSLLLFFLFMRRGFFDEALSMLLLEIVTHWTEEKRGRNARGNRDSLINIIRRQFGMNLSEIDAFDLEMYLFVKGIFHEREIE